MSELDERKEAVLRAVVEEYVTTAEPVGSGKVAKTRELGVSSATVRNDMAALEREGYLDQPHTSAGRVPTDKGYRYFVDHLGEIERLRAPFATTVEQFFQQAQSALEDMLHETSRLLARITNQAGLVIGPHSDASTVMSVQLVPLQGDVVLVVAVLSNGGVEKVVLRLDADTDEACVARGGAAADAAAKGNPLADLGPIEPTGDADADALARAALEGLSDRADAQAKEPVFVGGTSNIAAELADFSAAETVSKLLELLEQQFLVVTLTRNLIDQGVTVRIGAENDRVELKECAVIMAPVVIGDEMAGTVGVLGPTRMDYVRAMAAVSTISKNLGRHLSA